MKILAWTFGCVLFGSIAASAYDYDWEVPKEYQFELRGPATFIFPKDEGYKTVFGGGIQAIHWMTNNIGFSVGIDLQLWKPDEEQRVTGVDYSYGIPINWSATLDGSASMLPLGISGLYKIHLNPETWVTTEAGVRYVIVTSDFDATYTAWASNEGRYARSSEIYPVDIDNGAVGFAGIDIFHELSEGWGLFCGVGYQFDIAKGKASIDGVEIGENELAGAFVRGGFILGF